jgi:hypothetical protein
VRPTAVGRHEKATGWDQKPPTEHRRRRQRQQIKAVDDQLQRHHGGSPAGQNHHELEQKNEQQPQGKRVSDLALIVRPDSDKGHDREHGGGQDEGCRSTEEQTHDHRDGGPEVRQRVGGAHHQGSELAVFEGVASLEARSQGSPAEKDRGIATTMAAMPMANIATDRLGHFSGVSPRARISAR